MIWKKTCSQREYAKEARNYVKRQIRLCRDIMVDNAFIVPNIDDDGI